MHVCDNCTFSRATCGWYRKGITECKAKKLTPDGKPKKKKK